MTKKILIPVDGSESATRALDYAADRLSAEPDATAVVLTVHPPVHLYGEVRMYINDDKAAQVVAAHDRRILDPAIAKLRKSNIIFTTESAEGNPAEMIVERANRTGCTEIVMGTRGLGPVGGLVMGSVASKVVHYSSIPVTLVK
jgi:nucleotide-binding universal stress UspA family protein